MCIYECVKLKLRDFQSLDGLIGRSAGKRVVQVPKNDCQLVDLRGVVAVMSEKHKPGTMSDGALLRGAYQAGAAAVIKIGGGGAAGSQGVSIYGC